MTATDSMVADTWYVVQTKPRQEAVAHTHLVRQGFACTLPLLKVERIHRGCRTWAEEPLFSRYLFVSSGGQSVRWGAIRNTRGVSRLVEFGGVPAKLPVYWIEHFKTFEHAPRPLFTKGDSVLIRRGPLAGMEGIYDMPDGDDRAVVLLQMLGRSCKAVLETSGLRAA